MPGENKRDYYEVLGVARSASDAELRRAYRTLARKYHPDVSKEADAEAKFKEINEAYQVLNDQETRARYDRFGHAGVDPNGMAGGFGDFGFGDIFGDLFGFGGRGARQAGPHRGGDLRYDLEITFKEAAFGCKKGIEISRQETCRNCGGTGAEPGTSPIRCPDCNGTGQVRRAQQSIFGSFVNVTTCARCSGRGEIVTTPCSVCHGSQRVEETRSLEVDVPEGVDDGMRIRLAGEGAAGTHGGPAGNLYVVLHVEAHPYFHRREDDIVLNLRVNIAQAALGDEVAVPTIDGEERLTIPAGTQTGTVFRLRSRGVPHLRNAGRGDQVVIINVGVPTELNAEQRELLTNLGKTLGREVVPQGSKGFLDRLRDAFGV